MNQKSIHVLLLESDTRYSLLLETLLPDDRFLLSKEPSITLGMARIEADPQIAVALLDETLLAREGGMKIFSQLQNAVPRLATIIMAEREDSENALNAVHEGVQDYLVMPELTRHLLIRSIQYAVERKRSEAALLEAEEKYRGIFENIVEGIFQTSADGKYISANPALARIYGYDSPEEMKQRLTNIAQDLYVQRGRRKEFISLMERHDIVKDFQSEIYRKDGSIIWISENVRAVRDTSGKILFYEGTVEDITDRKRSEQQLRNSEALYHSLVENLPQNIFRKNLAEQFTFANKRFCDMLGKPLEEILGKTDFDFFPPELARKYQKDDHLIMQTGRMLETIEENHPQSGEKLYVNVVKTPLYDATGEIIGLQGIFWDITEKIRTEEKIRKATQDLAESQEKLSAKNKEMEDDLRMAREIQQAIIPQQYPSFPKHAAPEESTLQFFHRYIPTGAVGGDFFNILALSDTKAGVFICDVMGHGVRSALVTAILRALVEELTRFASDPGELLTHINRDLRAILQQSGTPLYTTAFYMVVDVETGQIHYANAGHPKPLIARRASGMVDVLKNDSGKSNPALGLMASTVYPTSTSHLDNEDLIILFTDGLYDVEYNADMLSPEWFQSEVKKRIDLPAGAIFDEILEQLKGYCNGSGFSDDVCIVGMELKSKPN
ncbi:MAG: PAS domain S-box protein [Verrucomicrobiota bacterium]|nr:PAS domain S-box protein [Verrucomicrobiota bacterium]